MYYAMQAIKMIKGKKQNKIEKNSIAQENLHFLIIQIGYLSNHFMDVFLKARP